jgi:hypothetical protein
MRGGHAAVYSQTRATFESVDSRECVRHQASAAVRWSLASQFGVLVVAAMKQEG